MASVLNLTAEKSAYLDLSNLCSIALPLCCDSYGYESPYAGWDETALSAMSELVAVAGRMDKYALAQPQVIGNVPPEEHRNQSMTSSALLSQAI